MGRPLRIGAAVLTLAVAPTLACLPRPALVRSTAAVYWCSMHPTVRGVAGGKCPICAMPLVPARAAIGDRYTLDVDLSPAAPQPREVTRVRFRVRDPKTGAAVTRFDVLHERLFHLFVVSRDLKYFAHVHPVLGGNGAFEVGLTLPQAGHYHLLADLVPTGAPPQLMQRSISTAGFESPLSEVPALDADLDDKVIANTRIRLVMRDAVAGGERLMTFSLFDATTGAPASDIEPYLGAPGHLLVVNANLSSAVHSHPLAQEGPVSSVAFQVLFPRAGMHRAWLQFQRSGRVITAAFTIPVDERQPTGT